MIVSEPIVMMLWLIIFFIIFYFYIDVRINKLRKELLSHYLMCEDMMSMKKTEHFNAFATDQDIVPTREETARGLHFIQNQVAQPSTTACPREIWNTPESRDSSNVEGYTKDTTEYASFNINDWGETKK